MANTFRKLTVYNRLRYYPESSLHAREQVNIHVSSLQPDGNPFIKTYSGVNTDVSLFFFKIP